MTRSSFFSGLFFICLFFVFIKIYQHNLLIKLNYEKQRLEKKNLKLKRKKNMLLVELFKLKDFKRIKNIAEEKFDFHELKLSQIKTFTHDIKKKDKSFYV